MGRGRVLPGSERSRHSKPWSVPYCCHDPSHISLAFDVGRRQIDDGQRALGKHRFNAASPSVGAILNGLSVARVPGGR